MENYIFYCYKDWRNEREGSISKQISRLTVVAIILLTLLLATLIVFFVILGLAISGNKNDDSILTATSICSALYVILCIITSIYSENYQIKHSKKGLEDYKKYCDDMREKVIIQHGFSEDFIPVLIERFNAKINGTDEKIKIKHEHFNKFFEMLLIPVSVILLGALLDKGTDTAETLGLGISGILIILTIYAASFFILYVYDFAMKMPQNKYREFVTDLQSILDFKKCETVNESDGDVTAPSSTDSTQEGSVVNT